MQDGVSGSAPRRLDKRIVGVIEISRGNNPNQHQEKNRRHDSEFNQSAAAFMSK